MIKKVMSYVLSSMAVCIPIHALIVGSNTAVSRQALVTFPEADSNNTMLGFGAFEDGFRLETFATTCTFDAYFPVGGTVQLDGGSLWLARDMEIEQGASIATVGTIASNNKSLRITTTVDLVVPSGEPSDSFLLKFITSVSFGSSANYVRSVDWTFDSAFIAAGSQNDELRVYSFDGSTLALEASQSFGIDVVTVRCHPSDYYIAMGTALDAGGDEFRVFDFDPSGPSLTELDSVNYGAIRAISWHPTGTYVAIVRETPAPEVAVYSWLSESLSLVASANFPTASTTIYDNMSFSGDGAYVAVGTYGTNELHVYSFTGTSLDYVTTATPSGGGGIAAVDWSPTSSYLAVGLAAGTQRLRIYSFDGITLTDESSAYVGEATAAVQDTHWNSEGTAVAIGRVAGTGTDFRTYYFDKDTVTLTLIGGFDLVGSVASVRFSPDDTYIAEGDNSSRLGVYLAQATGLNEELIFSDLKATMFSNVLLTKPLRFKGSCTVNGNNNVLYLTQDSELRVDSGASVRLENIVIDGVHDHNICFLDSTASMTLANATWLLDADFTLTQGSITFDHDVVLSGTHIFSYESGQQSVIASQSTLYLDEGLTFSYAPPAANKNLLAMVDSTSKLHLNGVTLRATSTGLQLTKGTIVIEGECIVESAASVAAEGIEFGGGTSDTEVIIKILPESGIEVASGYVVYNNVT